MAVSVVGSISHVMPAQVSLSVSTGHEHAKKSIIPAKTIEKLYAEVKFLENDLIKMKSGEKTVTHVLPLKEAMKSAEDESSRLKEYIGEKKRAVRKRANLPSDLAARLEKIYTNYGEYYVECLETAIVSFEERHERIEHKKIPLRDYLIKVQRGETIAPTPLIFNDSLPVEEVANEVNLPFNDLSRHLSTGEGGTTYRSRKTIGILKHIQMAEKGEYAAKLKSIETSFTSIQKTYRVQFENAIKMAVEYLEYDLKQMTEGEKLTVSTKDITSAASYSLLNRSTILRYTGTGTSADLARAGLADRDLASRLEKIEPNYEKNMRARFDIFIGALEEDLEKMRSRQITASFRLLGREKAAKKANLGIDVVAHIITERKSSGEGIYREFRSRIADLRKKYAENYILCIEKSIKYLEDYISAAERSPSGHVPHSLPLTTASSVGNIDLAGLRSVMACNDTGWSAYFRLPEPLKDRILALKSKLQQLQSDFKSDEFSAQTYNAPEIPTPSTQSAVPGLVDPSEEEVESLKKKKTRFSDFEKLMLSSSTYSTEVYLSQLELSAGYFGARAAAKILATEVKNSRLPAPVNLLDVGAGVGVLPIALDKEFANVGIDFSANITLLDKREKMQKYAPQGVKYVVADAQTMPFGAGAFDWVVSNYVMGELKPDTLSKVIDEEGRVLSPGGVLAFTVPASFKPSADMLREFERKGYSLKIALEVKTKAGEISFDSDVAQEALDETKRRAEHSLYLIVAVKTANVAELDPAMMHWDKEKRLKGEGAATEISEARLRAQELAKQAIKDGKLSVDTVEIRSHDVMAEESEAMDDAIVDTKKLVRMSKAHGQDYPTDKILTFMHSARSGEFIEPAILAVDSPSKRVLAKASSDVLMRWWVRNTENEVDAAQTKLSQIQRHLVQDMEVETLIATLRENLKERVSALGSISDEEACYAALLVRNEFDKAEEFAGLHKGKINVNRVKSAMDDALFHDAYWLLTKAHREELG